MTETVFTFLATFGAVLFGLALLGFVVDVVRAAWSVLAVLRRSRREWPTRLRTPRSRGAFSRQAAREPIL